MYEDDKRYGGLIVSAPYINLLALVMIPFYLCVKDESKLRAVNDTYTKVAFLPLALLFTVIFMALNLVSLPFAYIVAILKKVSLMRSQQQFEEQSDYKMQRIEGLVQKRLQRFYFFYRLAHPS